MNINAILKDYVGKRLSIEPKNSTRERSVVSKIIIKIGEKSLKKERVFTRG